jgi:hypothetical protein
LGTPKLTAWLDRQSRFAITAGFALAVAEVHGMELDKEQSRALVLLLSNVDVSSRDIAIVATELARPAEDGGGRTTHTHWATTLAELLPGSNAMSLVAEVGSSHIRNFRSGLSSPKQAAFDAGAAGVASGVARFGFGREVVRRSRSAFPKPPDVFPEHLTMTVKTPRKPISAEPLKRAAATVRGAVSALFRRGRKS